MEKFRNRYQEDYEEWESSYVSGDCKCADEPELKSRYAWNHQQAKIDKLEAEKLQLIDLGTDQIVTEKIERLERENRELELFVEFVKTRTDMVFNGLRFEGETLSLLQDAADRLLAKIKSEGRDDEKR